MKTAFGFIGYGKMGKAVEELAKEKGYQTTVATSKDHDGQRKALLECALIFDFSASDVVMEHIHYYAAEKKPLVVGTTGWEKDLGEAKKVVEKCGSALFFAPNFSIGLYLFSKVLKEASLLFRDFSEFDVGALDIHHKQKKDAPSGTMNLLKEMVGLENPKAISSLRVGHFAGTHSFYFDSEAERVTLTHESKNRRALAQGALIAGEWLLGKKGFFTMEDLCKKN